MRAALSALVGLALLPGCREALAQGIPGSIECSAIHGECSSIAGHPPEGGAAPEYPTQPTFWFAARLETAYAHLDPVCAPQDFGTLGQPLSQSTGTACFTFHDPCEEGVANNAPCFVADGGDHSDRASAEAAYRFLHNGTGATCVAVYEPSGTLTRVVLDTADFSGEGVTIIHSSTTDRLAIINATPAAVANATVDTFATGTVNYISVAHSTASDPDWTTHKNGAAGSTGSYSNAASNTGPASALAIGARANGGTAIIAKLHEIACWDSLVDLDEIDTVVEYHYGATWPQVEVVAVSSPPEQKPAPLAIPDAARKRVQAYVRAALAQHKPLASIVTRIAQRTGHTERVVREAARRAYGRTGRDPDTLTQERVGILVRNADVAALNEAYAQAKCKPLVDEEDETASACLTGNRMAFNLERFCLVSNGNDVARGARFTVTAGEWAAFNAEWQALSSTVRGRTVLVRDATDAAYLAAWQTAGVERCPEAS